MKSSIYFFAAGAALIFAGERSWQALRSAAELRTTQSRLQRQQHDSGPEHPSTGTNPSLVAKLGSAAKLSGVKTLLSVGTSESDAAGKINLEWEADPTATLRFMSLVQAQALLGACARLEIASNNSNDLLRVRGSFDPGGEARPSNEIPQVPKTKNVFVALWKDNSQESMLAAQALAARKQSEVQRREQDKAEQERRVREEAQQIEAKKRELQSQLVLNGIVNNGHEAMAFVNSQLQGGQTLMVRNGDTIADARVTSIDEKNGEVRLDYLGKFQVSLRLVR